MRDEPGYGAGGQGGAYCCEHGPGAGGHHDHPACQPPQPGDRSSQDGRGPSPVLLGHAAGRERDGAGPGQETPVADEEGQVGLHGELTAHEVLHEGVGLEHLGEGVLDTGGEHPVADAEEHTAERPPPPCGCAGAQGQGDGTVRAGAVAPVAAASGQQPLAQLASGVQVQAGAYEDRRGQGQEGHGLPAHTGVGAGLLDQADGGEPGQEAYRAVCVADATQQEPGDREQAPAAAGGARGGCQGGQDEAGAPGYQPGQDQGQSHDQGVGHLKASAECGQGGEQPGCQGGQGDAGRGGAGVLPVPDGCGVQELTGTVLLVPAGARHAHECPHEAGHRGQVAQDRAGEEGAERGVGGLQPVAGSGKDDTGGGGVRQRGGGALLGCGVHAGEGRHAVQGQQSRPEGPGEDAAPLASQGQAGQGGEHGHSVTRRDGEARGRAHDSASVLVASAVSSLRPMVASGSLRSSS